MQFAQIIQSSQHSLVEECQGSALIAPAMLLRQQFLGSVLDIEVDQYELWSKTVINGDKNIFIFSFEVQRTVV